MIEKERLVKFSTYAAMKGVTVPSVYLWEKLGKIKVEDMDGTKYVVLNDKELEQRKSLFRKFPTKGTQRIGDVISAMLNGEKEE